MLPGFLVFERKIIIGLKEDQRQKMKFWIHFNVNENQCGSTNKKGVLIVLLPVPSSNRSCSETYRMPVMEYKMNEGVSYEFKFPFRNNNKWQRNANKGSHSPQVPSQVQSPMTSRLNAGKGDGKMPPPERAANIPRSISSDGRPLERR